MKKYLRIILHQNYIFIQIEFLVIKITTLLSRRAQFLILFLCGAIKKKMEHLIKIPN